MAWIKVGIQKVLKYPLLVFSYFIPLSVPLGVPVFEVGSFILPFLMIIPTVLYTYFFIEVKPFRSVRFSDKLIALYPILGPFLVLGMVVGFLEPVGYLFSPVFKLIHSGLMLLTS